MMRPSDYVLSPSEMRLVQAYRKLTDKAQRLTLAIVENYATDDLLTRPELKRPALRIVSGARA